MSKRSTRDQRISMLSISIPAGAFVGLSITLALSAVGLPLLESSVFAVLSGFTLGAFLYRERSLTLANQISREEQRAEVARLEEHMQYYYEHALVNLAYFDAGTLLVDRVSPGFLQLLRIPPDLKVRGKSIVDLLHVSASSLEAIVGEAQRGEDHAKAHVLFPEDSQGSQFKVELTAKYYREAHMVEAAFFVSPVEGREDYEEVAIARKDLDRFRRGMYRRETRILELKEEVNQILKESGKGARYRFNQRSQDIALASDKSKTEDWD